MRKFAIIPMSLCILPALFCAPQELKFTPEQQAIINVHKSMWQALGKRDLDTWSRYVAADCIFSNEDGDVRTRTSLIAQLRTMPPEYDRSENHRDFLVRVYGDTAVLNFRVTAHEQFNDADIVTEVRETETFARLSGAWRLIAVQWGALPVNFRKATADHSSNLKDYAGDYEWRPKGPVDHVFFREGKLLSRLNEEQEDHEYLPSGGDIFFLHDDLGEVKFVRDTGGRVTGYIYHRSDGQEIHVKKIR